MLLAWLVPGQWAFSQANHTGDPLTHVYTPEDYDGPAQVWCAVEDNRGVMHFGVEGAVLQFDGTHWKQIPIDNGSIVFSIQRDSAGTIFVGAAGEFGYLKPDAKGQLRYQSLVGLIEAEEHRAFSQVLRTNVWNGKVYFNTPSRIFVYDYKGIEVLETPPSSFINFVANGRYFIGNYANGICELTADHRVLVPQKNVFVEKDIFGILPYDESRVLVATRLHGLYLYDLSVMDSVSATYFETTAPGINRDGAIYNAVALVNGNFGFGTLGNGFFEINPEGELVRHISARLPDPIVIHSYNSSSSSGKNVLWLSLNTGIVSLEFLSPFSIYDEIYKLSETVYSITEIDSTIYITTVLGAHRLRYTAGGPIFDKVQGIGDQSWCFAQVEVEGGQRTFIANNGGLFELDAASNSARSTLPGVPPIYALTAAGPGQLYAACRGQFLRFDVEAGSLSKTKIYENENLEFRDIHLAGPGDFWLSTKNNGLVNIRVEGQDTLVDIYDATSGLRSINGLELGELEGELVACSEAGMFIFDAESRSFVPHPVFSAYFDSKQAGVLKFVKMPDQEAIVGIIYRGNRYWVERISARPGGGFEVDSVPYRRLPNGETMDLFIDSELKLWLARGAVLYSFDYAVLDRIEPKLDQDFLAVIHRVQAGRDSVLFHGTFALEHPLNDTLSVAWNKQPDDLVFEVDYAHNTLVFEFASPYFEGIEATEFSVRLKNYDNQWSPWTKETKKEFTNLFEGTYVFQVKARNIHGQESRVASFTFRIRPPYYRTVLAYLLYLVSLVLLVIGVVKLNSRRLVKEKQQLEKIVRERTAEIVQQRDEIAKQKQAVESQKEEIEKQASELAQKNIQLEQIDIIVQSINEEVNFTSLMRSILSKLHQIKGAEHCYAVLLNKQTHLYEFAAKFGFEMSDEQLKPLSVEETHAELIGGTEALDESIRYRAKLGAGGGHPAFVGAHSRVVILINVPDNKDQIEGFIVLDNPESEDAFSSEAFSLLRNLKEHLVSAFIKTQILEDLQMTLINLRETQEELVRKEKMASIGQLTQGIVDRIINPLNYINNFSEVSTELTQELKDIIAETREALGEDASEGQDLLEEQVEVIEMINGNLVKINQHGVTATRIIKEMEALMKAKPTRFYPSDLSAMAREAAQQALAEGQNQFRGFEPELAFELEELDPVNVIPEEFGKALLYIARNAIYSLAKKQERVGAGFAARLRVSLRVEDELLLLCFEDNGLGIPEKNLPKIFDPLFTTKPTAEGTGLGLYSGIDIVKQHKGTIAVESEDGAFARFTVSIPIAKPKTEENES